MYTYRVFSIAINLKAQLYYHKAYNYWITILYFTSVYSRSIAILFRYDFFFIVIWRIGFYLILYQWLLNSGVWNNIISLFLYTFLTTVRSSILSMMTSQLHSHSFWSLEDTHSFAYRFFLQSVSNSQLHILHVYIRILQKHYNPANLRRYSYY